MSFQITRVIQGTSSCPARLVAALAVLGVLASACGAPGGQAGGSSGSTDQRLAAPEEAACGVGGSPTFAASFLNGPELSPEEFVDTPVGAVMEAFFVGGPGGPEGDQYRMADGFSIVSDSYVLGYHGQVPDSDYTIEDGAVSRWGGCNPHWVSADLAATPWHPAGPVDVLAGSIPIEVEGEACVTDSGTDVLTELVTVNVEETDDQVTITVWTRDEGFQGMCAGVGITLDGVAELESPLGNRTLLDGGTIPAQDVEFIASEGPVPPSTAPEVDDSSLGRLSCGLGVVAEDRVADSGQDPLEIAQAAAPAVVEVEPGQPLWWWGLNDNGAVIVGLALGDVENADYQVWTCDPPLGSDATPEPNPVLPQACTEFEELYPGANEVPESGEIVAELPFGGGLVVIVRTEQSGVVSFHAIECFEGGGAGFEGGEPGETWQGCYRVDYSDAGYAIAIVENANWDISVAGERVEVIPAGDVGVALVEGSFDRPPPVAILSSDTGGC